MHAKHMNTHKGVFSAPHRCTHTQVVERSSGCCLKVCEGCSHIAVPMPSCLRRTPLSCTPERVHL
eukprot:7497356-Heterocapsa_arctica.AAC.1